MDTQTDEILINGNDVRKLYADGLIDDAARGAAESWLGEGQAWWRWTSRALLVVGSLLMAAGVVFFFAFNWARLSAGVKFGIVEAVLALLLVAARWVGIDKLVGKVLLLVATIVMGAAWAVFGQIYQTGADAFELFVAWAILSFGWVVAARFSLLWLVWLGIANVGLMLYGVQVGIPNGVMSDAGLCLLLATLSGAWLVWREVCLLKGACVYLRAGWVRWAVWAWILMSLLVPVVQVVGKLGGEAVAWVALIVFAFTTIAGGRHYLRREKDLGAVAVALFAWCIVVLTFIGRLLLNRDFEVGGLFLFGFAVIGVCAAAAWWLRLLSAQIRAGRQERV